MDETKDTVTLDGHSFSYQKYFYYMLHKPAGVVTAVRDHHDQTVLDLLRTLRERSFPGWTAGQGHRGAFADYKRRALAHRLLSL